MADTVTVERSAVIDAPPAAIYERLVDFHRWPAWSPWYDLDPEMHKEFGGAESGVGATYAWKGSRKVGQGSMEITSVEADRRVDLDLHFLKPFASENTTTFLLEPVEGGTRVTWRMVAPQPLLMKLLGRFVSMDKMVGPDFEKGLERLRADVASA